MHGKYIYPMFVLSITTKSKKMSNQNQTTNHENVIETTEKFQNWKGQTIHFELVYNWLHSEYRVYRYENGELESSVCEGKSASYSKGVMEGLNKEFVNR